MDDDPYCTDWFHPDESVALGKKTRILKLLAFNTFFPR